MLEESGIQNGHKLMSFYFFIKSIFKNLHGMLSISLKLLETFLVFLFLKQGCAQAESGGPAGHSGFYSSEQWATFNFPQNTALSNEFLCRQIVVLSLTKKAMFVI